MRDQKPKLLIDWATFKSAKYACENWHYSKCVPKGSLIHIGTWEDDVFIGAVIFGRGATNALGSPYKLTNTEVCELVRIAFRNHQTPISKIISIAIKFLRKQCPGLKLIVSFADPEQGHHGGIYQASNWIYSGKSAPFKYPIYQGKVVHPRQISHLVKRGKIKDRTSIQTVLKPGKHRYLMPLTDKMRLELERFKKPYPKRVSSKAVVAPDHRSGEPGSTPRDTLQK